MPAVWLAGAAYLVAGRAVPTLTSNVRVWRLAAWGVSLVVFAAHIAHEHYRLRHPPRTAAAKLKPGELSR